jgi:5-oxoprolinase (ATP-hydrolysing) subunit B
MLTIEFCGDRALLVRGLPTAAAANALQSIPGIRQTIATHLSLLVEFAPGTDLDARAADLKQRLTDRDWPAPPTRTIDVPFADTPGLDAALIGERLNLGWPALREAFAAIDFTVAQIGFRPGFPYLLGLPSAWQQPRRATPRPEVPAGSIALGGPYAGIYPSASPGGWLLLGSTPMALFDVSRDPPNALRAGDRVRFVPCR